MLNLSKVALLSTLSGESPCLAALPLHDVKVNRLRLPVIRTHSKVYMIYLSETLFLFHRSLSRLHGYPEGPGETPTPTPISPSVVWSQSSSEDSLACPVTWISL